MTIASHYNTTSAPPTSRRLCISTKGLEWQTSRTHPPRMVDCEKTATKRTRACLVAALSVDIPVSSLDCGRLRAKINGTAQSDSNRSRNTVEPRIAQ